MFQPKAWVDGAIAQRYIKDLFYPFMQEQRVEHALLFLDNLAAQQTEDAREIYMSNSTSRQYFFPPNNIDLIQPVDRHLVQQLKAKMASLLDERLDDDEAFRVEWLGLKGGTFVAWHVRV